MSSVMLGAAALLRQPGASRHSSLILRRWCATVDSSADTHSDFKPQYKTEPVHDVASSIKDDISKHQVFLYMKGIPGAPQCGFSNLACQILNAYGVKFGSRNVLADPAVREGIKKFSNWPTVPQVYVKGEFVGGSDILMSMHEKGELETLLGPIRKEQEAAKK